MQHTGSIQLYTDSQAAQTEVGKYVGGVNYRNVYSADLLIQAGSAIGNFDWVEGHNGNLGHELADFFMSNYDIELTGNRLVFRPNKFMKTSLKKEDSDLVGTNFCFFQTLQTSLKGNDNSKRFVNEAKKNLLESYYNQT